MSRIEDAEITDAGELVVQHIGALSEATEQLSDESLVEKVEPEEVGRWITVIGRALAAIFKI